MSSPSHSNDLQGQEHPVEELSAVIDNLVDGLLVTDMAGRITRFNAALSVMLGLQEIPLLGRDCQAVLTRDLADIIAQSRLQPTEIFSAEIEKTVRQPDMNTSAGHYVYTPDDQPLIGPVPEVPGFYVNCGYWAGVMLSPEAGKRIADLVTGKLDPKENPLRPTRYQEGLGKKGKTLMSH